MDLNRLHEILRECTIQLRKGEQLTEANVGPVRVTTIDLNPHENEARPDLERVDLLLLTVGVDKVKAEKHKAELISLLRDFPERGMLERGPSYIHIGGVIGDQGAAFQLMALGKVLGLWDIITAETMGADRQQAIDAASTGWIMTSGFRALVTLGAILIALPAYAQWSYQPQQQASPSDIIMGFRPTPNVGTVYDPYRRRPRQTVCDTHAYAGGYDTTCHEE